MSIFRDTFTPEISASLDVRQNAMVNRTPQNIQYLNARNSWIRMTSAVDVNGDGGKLAKQYVLLGGTLNQNQVTLPGGAKVDVFTPKAGVGDSSNAYSRTTPSGKNHRLGIRPMPGITSVDVKSLTAYGSLRQITVNFICWDIAQLEDLELLYMRPGYTVLIEWGWLPYLDTKGNLVTNSPQFYDILNKPPTNRTKIFRELYEKSKKSGGNYDAMYGYIKNYQWSARSDGGYDCQTTVISTGEIIESLKVNYVRPDLVSFNNTGFGLLNSEFASPPPNVSLAYYYQKNILAGIWAETYSRLLDQNKTFPPNSVFTGPQGSKFANVTFPGLTTPNTDLPKPTNAASGSQVYITLEAAFDIINKYIVPESSGDTGSLVTLSLKSSDIVSPTGSDLYCIAHPTQLSINPTVCLINSPLWSDTGQIATAISGAAATPITTQIQSIVNDIQNARNNGFKNTDLITFANAVGKITDLQTFSAVEQTLGSTFQDIITNEIQNKTLQATSQTATATTPATYPLQTAIDALRKIPGLNVSITSTPKSVGYQGGVTNYVELTSITITGSPNASAASLVAVSINGQSKQAIATLSLLQALKPFFYNNDPYSEIGVIKNIYVNVEFLYKKALDGFTESQDTNQKNEINLYNYVKSIISSIQQSIGNINNFEVHVDPIDNNVAKVIDVNYTQPDKAKKKNLFELQVHNLKSVVRTYSLQSQIFPNQSSLIAIGSQAKGGQLGIQNNTMIDFNRTLRDRIIPEKTFGGESSLTVTNNETPLAANLAGIIQLYSALSKPPDNSNAPKVDAPTPTNTTSTDFGVLYSTAKNNLKDLIVYFQSIPDLESSSANRNIIPIQFSFEMDGIGGLVIGHLFTINQDILPIGYKGPNLAQTVTRISHTISNNDWVTKIDALNIILNNKAGKVKFQNLDLVKIINTSLNGAFANNQPTTSQPAQAPLQFGPCGALQSGETPVGASNTDINYLISAVINNLEGGYYDPATHFSSLNARSQQLYATSGETMFGIDIVNGIGYRRYDPIAWDTFWSDIWTAQGYTVTGTIGSRTGISRSGTASRPWSLNYMPRGLPADKLYRLAASFMSKAADNIFKSNNIDPNLERIIKSDGRLYYNFLYAVWNGTGWFRGWITYISQKYASGITSSSELTKLFVEDRRNGGVASIPNANASAKQLISQSGQKICRHVGNL